MKVYGPYTRKDGRQHVILIDPEGLRRTVSYPKYLMEQKLGAKRVIPQTFTCPMCPTVFELSGRKLHDANIAKERGKAGPFCSRRCAGRYGAAIQNNRINKKSSNVQNKEYYKEQRMEKISD